MDDSITSTITSLLDEIINDSVDQSEQESVLGKKRVEHGAIVQPTKQCQTSSCTNVARKNGLCKGCGAYPCTTEGCLGNVYYRDPEKKFCYHCFCTKHNFIPSNIKLREKYFHKLITNDFNELKFNYNKSQPNDCKQTRYPDWSKDFGSFLLIVECDEKQHRGESYLCEDKRTVQIYQNAAHRPIVFIRFNPDNYVDDTGESRQGCFRWGVDQKTQVKDMKVDMNEVCRRWALIKKQIKFYTQNLENPPTKAITIHKLFYDGFNS